MVRKIQILSIIMVVMIFVMGCALPFIKSSNTPTVEYEETDTPSSVEPTVLVTATKSIVDTSTNPCYNIFYPLSPGNQWVYKINSAENVETATPDPNDTYDQIGITVTTIDGNQAKLDALDLSSGVITQTVVECDNGAIKNFPLLTLSLIFGDQANGAAQIDYQNGVFMPSETELMDKNWVHSWSGDYVLKGNFTAQDDEDQIVFTISDSPMNLKWESKGIRESVEVPAGIFPDAVRVDRETEMNISIQLNSGTDAMKFDGVLTFENTLWYQPNVGLLKEEVHSANISYRGMTFPVVVTGDLELQEFRPKE